MRESLEEKTVDGGTRKLWQSILPLPASFDGNKLTVEIKGEKYWKFINDGVEGVGGKKANGDPWVKKSFKSPFSYKKDKKPSVKHFVDWAYLVGKSPFMVRESVFHRGLTPNHFFDEVINKKFEQELADKLSAVMGRVIEVDIKTDFDGK